MDCSAELDANFPLNKSEDISGNSIPIIEFEELTPNFVTQIFRADARRGSRRNAG